MINFRFTRKCKQSRSVQIEVETDLYAERPVLSFDFETGYQYSAALLREYLAKQFIEAIRNAHGSAYELGFKDGKAHKKKRKYFNYRFTDKQEDIGW